MKELTAKVIELVKDEYDQASTKFGLKHNSPHEAYAVIKEELEETQDEIAKVAQQLDQYWEAVKRNDNPNDNQYLEKILIAATDAAAEVIQVAAMALKALQGYGGEGA